MTDASAGDMTKTIDTDHAQFTAMLLLILLKQKTASPCPFERIVMIRRCFQMVFIKQANMSLGTILLIILILILLGVFPTWPHSASWAMVPPGSSERF